MPFTRKAMMLIVDTETSTAFQVREIWLHWLVVTWKWPVAHEVNANNLYHYFTLYIQSLSSVFGQPVIVLMSPCKLPHTLQGT